MAKKNLCFELEYIQTVCQSINVRSSVQFERFLEQQKESDVITAGNMQ